MPDRSGSGCPAWLPRLLLISAAAAGAVLLYAFNPAGHRLFPPCPFRWLTGLLCPGCGSLRALHHLLHGDIPGAFRLNPLLVLVLPVLAGLALRPAWASRPWVAWTAFGVLVAYGILRNVPVWPFTLLAQAATL